MRIRKHAKISPLLYASSSLKTHVCQLNQSPWDVMTFSPPSSPPPPPPPPSQASDSGGRVGNGTSECFISVAERELSSRRGSEYREAATHNEENTAAKNEGNMTCCKTDGKSWQCRQEAAEGNSLCEHHLSLVKSYSSVGHHAASKSGKAAEEAQRRTRPKKPLTSSSSNPYEFYYYSGFGPSWGKRRGEARNNSETSETQISIEDFDFADEEEEEEESRDNNGKKRVRKPIKARSLKSLL